MSSTAAVARRSAGEDDHRSRDQGDRHHSLGPPSSWRRTLRSRPAPRPLLPRSRSSATNRSYSGTAELRRCGVHEARPPAFFTSPYSVNCDTTSPHPRPRRLRFMLPSSIAPRTPAGRGTLFRPSTRGVSVAVGGATPRAQDPTSDLPVTPPTHTHLARETRWTTTRTALPFRIRTPHSALGFHSHRHRFWRGSAAGPRCSLAATAM